MSFVDNILNFRSVSIVGLAKNAGKTESLNYILNRIKNSGKTIAVTSIGLDGEGIDQVTQTHKPEIYVYDGMFFVTSETHYKTKQILAEIVDIDEQRTALGRLIIARALSDGKVLLSGPSDTNSLKIVLEKLTHSGVDTTIVDGALSRLSSASPAITDAMFLATGAAVSGNIPQLVRETKFVYDLIQLEQVDRHTAEKLADKTSGVWAFDDENMLYQLNIPSVLMLERYKDELFKYGTKIYAGGMISDKFLEFLRTQKNCNRIELIVQDFTKIFVSKENYYAFIKKGGKIKLLHKTKLLGISVNPTSPEGILLNSAKLIAALEEHVQVPVFDVRFFLN